MIISKALILRALKTIAVKLVEAKLIEWILTRLVVAAVDGLAESRKSTLTHDIRNEVRGALGFKRVEHGDG